MTLDCYNTNRDGPGRFRSEADNPDNQLCYFNSANDEKVYNEFVSKRIKSSDPENNFHFEIVEVKNKTNKNILFDATNKLQELNKNDTKTSGSSETFRGGAKRLSGFSGDDAGFSNVDSTYSKSATKTMESLEQELNQDI